MPILPNQPSIVPAEAEKSHFLLVGTLFAHTERHQVTTILGSCVSVCLWDHRRKIGGINHYMLPLWNGEGLASPKYGNIAIPKLIQKMLDLGADKKSLCAKIFGGGVVLSVTSPFMNIGERNILFAEDMLKQEQIPIISADTGGQLGRKLIFNTETGAVFVKKLTRQTDDVRVNRVRQAGEL